MTENMKLTFKIISTIVQTFIFILLPFVVFTLITSKTPIAGMQSFVVLSGSMSPKFPTGSIVYSKTMDEYNNNDVITFKNNSGQIVTHRIVNTINKNNAFQYVTKGDANETADKALVSQRDVIGKIIFFVPYLGFLVSFLKTSLGISLFIILPATMFIVLEIWNIKKEIERNIERKIKEKMQIASI